MFWISSRREQAENSWNLLKFTFKKLSKQAAFLQKDGAAKVSKNKHSEAFLLKRYMDEYLPKKLFNEGDLTFFAPDNYIIGLLIIGFVVLATALIPRLLKGQWITSPMIYLICGYLLFLIPVDIRLPTLLNNPDWMKRVTELGVIVALTGAGLKLTNPFTYATWRIAIRLLAITMPITIAAIAVFGWWVLALAPASAVLLGAVIAPTDPVLASDVQTTPPGKRDHSEAKLALTTEAGLNDGLAFPFTNLALAMMLTGLEPSNWFWSWLSIDFFYKIIVGVIGGLLSGWFFAFVVFKTKVRSHLAKVTTGIISISLTLVPYGVTELLHGYGFLAVFVAACMFRSREAGYKYQKTLHDFSEDIERLLIAILLVILGGYISIGAFMDLNLTMIFAALFILLIIRPLTAWLSLWGLDLHRKNRMIISFFGIRGVGSIYYFTYALSTTPFPQAEVVLDVLLLVIVGSIFAHGLLVHPAEKWLKGSNKTVT